MDGPIKLCRRGFLKGGAMMGAGLTLAACGSRLAANGQAGPVQLVYQDWRTEWFPPMAQAMLDEFHKDHPNIKVFYTPDPEDFQNQMVQDFRAGSAPDVFQGCCTHFPSWAQNGYTLNLASYVDSELDPAIIRDWDQAQYLALRTASGVQFGLPKYHGGLGIFYNKDVFDEYGVDYPDGSWDYGDYLAAMRMLADDRDGDGQVDQWGSALDLSWDRIQVHVNGWGGHLVNPGNPRLSAMAEAPALSAIQWLRDRMIDDQVLATPFHLQNRSLEDAFNRGMTAMIESGSWSLQAVLSGAPFRVGVAPFIHGPARRVTIATTDGFGIFAGTRYPDEAWELMKFLISPEYGRAMARANLLQPARESLVGEWVEFVHQAYPDKAADVDVAAFAEGHTQGYSVTAEIFANMDAARELAYQAWDEILVLGEKPVEYLTEVSRQINETQTEAG